MSHYRINSPNIVFENYENEVVLINLLNGKYYSIANIAAEIFGLIDKELLKVEIIDWVIRKYDGKGEEMVTSVEKYFEDLRNEGLIILEDKNSNTPPALTREINIEINNSVKPSFEVPVLNCYSDMQDLLLLDPVHEVDETGWPNPKPTDPETEK